MLLLSIVFTLVCVSGCCGVKKECLPVRGGEKVTYQCENGDRIGAKYYSLSDDRELVWWIKGDSAMVETRDQNGNWQLKYKDCKVVSDKK